MNILLLGFYLYFNGYRGIEVPKENILNLPAGAGNMAEDDFHVIPEDYPESHGEKAPGAAIQAPVARSRKKSAGEAHPPAGHGAEAEAKANAYMNNYPNLSNTRPMDIDNVFIECNCRITQGILNNCRCEKDESKI